MKPEDNLIKGATQKPGDFPLGSPRSRAAARALLENQQPDVVIRIRSNVHEGLLRTSLSRNHKGELMQVIREWTQ